MIVDTQKRTLADKLRGFWNPPVYRELPRINGKRQVPVLVSPGRSNAVTLGMQKRGFGKTRRLLNRKIEVAVRYNGKGQVIFSETKEGHLLIKHTR